MNIHLMYGLIVTITLVIFLVTIFVVGRKKKDPKQTSAKCGSLKMKGAKMAEKKQSMKKAEAKILAANLIVEWVKAELGDEQSMSEVLSPYNLTESGERKVMEAFDDLLAAVCKKAKVEMKA